MLSFKPAFSLSSFIVIKMLFSSSSLSGIRVVSWLHLSSIYTQYLKGNLLCSSLTVLPMGRAVEVMLICSNVIIDPRREGSKRFTPPRNSFKAQLKLFICTLYFFLMACLCHIQWFWVSSRNCSRTYPGYQNPQMLSHIHSLVFMVLHLQIQPTSNPMVLQYCMYLLKNRAYKVDLCSSNPCCSRVSGIYLFEQNFLPPSYLKMEVPLLGQPGVQYTDCMTVNLISTWSECC